MSSVQNYAEILSGRGHSIGNSVLVQPLPRPFKRSVTPSRHVQFYPSLAGIRSLLIQCAQYVLDPEKLLFCSYLSSRIQWRRYHKPNSWGSEDTWGALLRTRIHRSFSYKSTIIMTALFVQENCRPKYKVALPTNNLRSLTNVKERGLSCSVSY